MGCVVVLTVLLLSDVCAAEIQNPSFELTRGTGRKLPQSWWPIDDLSCFYSNSSTVWSTDGVLSVGLFSVMNKTVSRGKYESLYQDVDLTGISNVEFDVGLRAFPRGVFGHFQASLHVYPVFPIPPFVDRVPLWSQNVDGVYLDQQVKVAGMTGRHRIELRITALDSGTYSVAYWSLWDNIRLIKGPVTIPASIDLNPSTLNAADNGTGTLNAANHGTGVLNPASNGNWIMCHIELEEPYDVNAIDGATVTLNNTVPAHLDKQGWATPQGTAANVADYDNDGILERMVKFDRAAVQALVQAPEAEVTVKGRITNGPLFEGTAVIRVLDKNARKQ